MANPVVPLGWRGMAVGRWGSTLLLLDRTRPVEEATSAAEGAVLLTASGTVHALSARKVRGLRTASQKLVQAAAVVVALLATLEAFQAQYAQTVTARQQDAASRLTAAFGRGPRSLTLSARAMTVLEALVISIEMSFWYMVGAESLSSTAPLTARIPAVLVAVFVPLAGVLTARLSGLLLGRFLGAVGRRAMREVVLLNVSLTLLLVASGGTWYLVDWRYSGNPALGAREIPGAAMGLLFAIVLVVIALLHAAAVDHEGHEDQVRTGELTRLAAQQSELETSLIRAKHAQAATALQLCEQIDGALDEMERVLITGQVMVLAARAVRGVDPQTVTFAARTPHEPAVLTQPWAVDLHGPSVPVHAVARAVQVLVAYEPDTDSDRLADGVRQRLRDLFGRTPDGQTTDGLVEQVPSEPSAAIGEGSAQADDVEPSAATAPAQAPTPGPAYLSVVHDEHDQHDQHGPRGPQVGDQAVGAEPDEDLEADEAAELTPDGGVARA